MRSLFSDARQEVNAVDTPWVCQGVEEPADPAAVRTARLAAPHEGPDDTHRTPAHTHAVVYASGLLHEARLTFSMAAAVACGDLQHDVRTPIDFSRTTAAL